eukprot:10374218-Alexandrium_andersonii.AAC.1
MFEWRSTNNLGHKTEARSLLGLGEGRVLSRRRRHSLSLKLHDEGWPSRGMMPWLPSNHARPPMPPVPLLGVQQPAPSAMG